MNNEKCAFWQLVRPGGQHSHYATRDKMDVVYTEKKMFAHILKYSDAIYHIY